MNFKKFAWGMTSSALVLSMGAGQLIQVMPAQAVTPAQTASITLHSESDNPQDAYTYKTYKLFTTEGSGDAITYHVASKDALTDLQTTIKAIDSKVADTDINSEAKVIEWIQNNVMPADQKGTDSYGNEGVQTDIPTGKYRGFLKELSKHVDNLTPITTTGTATDTAITVDDNGYYMIVQDDAGTGKNTTNSLIMAAQVDEASETKTINLKSNKPQVIKKVGEDDGTTDADKFNDIADANIGQTVPFEYISKVPNMTAYKTYKIGFHDTYDAGLDMDESSVKVMIGDKDVTSSFTVTDKDNKLDISCNDIKSISGVAAGQEIKVTYNGKITAAAAKTAAKGLENSVNLEYSNNPYDDSSTGTTPTDTVVVFSYNTHVTKINDGTPAVNLKGAKFNITRKDTGAVMKFIDNKDGTYTYVENPSADQAVTADVVSQNASGDFKIYGLDEGSYSMKETAAPHGYDKLYGTISFDVKPTYQNARAAVASNKAAELKALADQTAGYVAGTHEAARTALATSGSYTKDAVNDPISLNEADTITNQTADVANGTVAFDVVNKKHSPLAFTGGQAGIMVLIAAGAGYVLVKENKKIHEAQE